MTCDCCLMPIRPGSMVGRGLDGLICFCMSCYDFGRAAGLGAADLADFIEFCWSIDTRSL